MSLLCSFKPVALVEFSKSLNRFKRFLGKSSSVLILGVRSKGHGSEVFLSTFPSVFPSTLVTPLCSGDMLTSVHLNAVSCVWRGNVHAMMFYFQRENKIMELGMPFFHIWTKTLLYFLLIKKSRRGQQWTGGEAGGLGVDSASSW